MSNTVKTTDLRVTDVSVASSSRPARQGSDAAIANRALRQRIRLNWYALPAYARAAYQALCTAMVARGQANAKLTAFFLYSSLCQAAYYASAATLPLTDAPVEPNYPLNLPDTLRLSCVRTGSEVSMHITGGHYAQALAVYGAMGMMSGTTVWGKSDWKLIGSLPGGIPSTGTGADLSAMYNAAFPVPQVGEKVAIKLVGVSASGFRTADFYYSAIVDETLAASAAGTDETETDKTEKDGSLHVV